MKKIKRLLEPAALCLVAISNTFPSLEGIMLPKSMQNCFSLARSIDSHTFCVFNDITYGFYAKLDARGWVWQKCFSVPRFLCGQRQKNPEKKLLMISRIKFLLMSQSEHSTKLNLQSFYSNHCSYASHLSSPPLHFHFHLLHKTTTETDFTTYELVHILYLFLVACAGFLHLLSTGE